MSFEAKIGEKIYQVSPTDLEQLNIIHSTNSTYHVIYENQSIEIELIHLNLDKNECCLSLDGVQMIVNIQDNLAQMLSQLGFNTSSSQSEKILKAPMPGLVLTLLVAEGDIVKIGDNLLILEAMKMENIIKSPTNGTIKTINCKASNTVDKGQILIEID